MIRIPGAVVLVSLAIRRKHHVQIKHTEMIALRFPLCLSHTMIDKTDRQTSKQNQEITKIGKRGGELHRRALVIPICINFLAISLPTKSSHST